MHKIYLIGQVLICFSVGKLLLFNFEYINKSLIITSNAPDLGGEIFPTTRILGLIELIIFDTRSNSGP